MTPQRHPGRRDVDPPDDTPATVRVTPAGLILAARDAVLDARTDVLPALVLDATQGVSRDALVAYLHRLAWLAGTTSLLEPDEARAHLRRNAVDLKENHDG